MRLPRLIADLVQLSQRRNEAAVTDSPYSPYSPATAPSPRRHDALALVAATLVGVALLLQVIVMIVQNTMLLSPDRDYAFYSVVAGISSVVIGIIAVVALVLGVIALARPGRRAWAGIAVGGAGVIVFNTLLGIFSSVMLSAMSAW